MHNRPVNKREQRYQLAKTKQITQRQKRDARLAGIGATAITSSSSLHFDSTHSMIALLLLSSLVIPVAAKVMQRSAAEFEAKDVLNGAQEPCGSKMQETKVCNTYKEIGNHPVLFGCSPNARIAYEKNPGKYREDVSHVHDLLQELHQQKVIQCKQAQLSQDKRFHIKFTAKEDMPDSTVEVLYDAPSVSVQIQPGTKNTSQNRKIIQHELHHGFVSNQNRKTRNSYHAGYDVGSVSPIADLKDQIEWGQHVVKGCRKISSLLSLLAKTPEELSHLNSKDKELFNAYLESSLAYEAYTHVRSYGAKDKLNKWVSEGYLDENYNVKGDGFSVTEKYRIDDVILEVKMRFYKYENKGGKHHFHARSVNDPKDNKHAALYDGLILIARALEGRQGPHQQQEADAYLHEIYESHPALFKLLFEDLQNFHLKKSSEEYQRCLKQ